MKYHTEPKALHNSYHSELLDTRGKGTNKGSFACPEFNAREGDLSSPWFDTRENAEEFPIYRMIYSFILMKLKRKGFWEKRERKYRRVS